MTSITSKEFFWLGCYVVSLFGLNDCIYHKTNFRLVGYQHLLSVIFLIPLSLHLRYTHPSIWSILAPDVTYYLMKNNLIIRGINGLDKLLNFQNIIAIENLKVLFLQVKYGHKEHRIKKY